MTTQEENQECGKLSEGLKRCGKCNNEMSATELFKYNECFVCRGNPFITEEGTIARETRDDKIERAWSRELKIN